VGRRTTDLRWQKQPRPLRDILTKQGQRGLESQHVILSAARNVTVTKDTSRNQLVEAVMNEVASHPNAEGTS
jgi:hypothetical protein